MSADELARRCSRRAELRLVMTAHPTEARRRTTIDKLARVFSILRELDEVTDRRRGGCPAPAAGHDSGAVDIRRSSGDHADRARRGPRGARPLPSTLAETVRRIYRDLEDAIAERFGDGVGAVAPLLSFGSWIGGDRDGNPFVTPEATVQALELMREQCLRLLEASAERLAGRLSLSERLAGHPRRADADPRRRGA